MAMGFVFLLSGMFRSLDYQSIFDNKQKLTFVFGGRNLVNAEELIKIRFTVHSIGNRGIRN